MKKMKPRELKLDYDSMSDITDLSDEGILTKSMHLLSKDQQGKLDKYMKELKDVRGYSL